MGSRSKHKRHARGKKFTKAWGYGRMGKTLKRRQDVLSKIECCDIAAKSSISNVKERLGR